MKSFTKKRLITTLLASGLLLADTSIAYATLQNTTAAHTPVQVMVKEARLPGGFVRIETVRWTGAPGRIQQQVKHLSPTQAAALWNHSMQQFQAIQTALSEQMMQAQTLLSAAFSQPFGSLPPTMNVAEDTLLFAVAPFWLQTSPPAQISPAQRGAPWIPQGTIPVRDVVHPGAHPKVPV
ncbi:hypothetical protein AB4090_14435 [Acidithiobacillus sp. IBUN Pt1247-S3]|uniref:hypothetical protein n=1 Tax=Acidithiobacillus sp. IBUN Pt1247-S3 TaxID=3166642 RepID=UPI0034E601E5